MSSKSLSWTLFTLMIVFFSTLPSSAGVKILGREGPTTTLNLEKAFKENKKILTLWAQRIEGAVQDLYAQKPLSTKAVSLESFLREKREWHLPKYTGAIRSRVFERPNVSGEPYPNPILKTVAIVDPGDEDSFSFLKKNKDVEVLLLIKAKSEQSILEFKTRSAFNGKMIPLQGDDWIPPEMGVNSYPAKIIMTRETLQIWEGIE